jgi:very-short-patch-repair endonuclease
MPRAARKVPHSRRAHNKSVEELALLLRNNMTKAEQWLWKHLKRRQKAWTHKFEPQGVMYGYIADFYCESLKLAVEVDGRIHDRKDVRRNDRLRTRRLKRHGVTVIRFSNAQVFSNVYGILAALEEAAL